MIASLPITRVPTLYARIGDAFVLACATLVLGLSILSLRFTARESFEF